MLNKIISVLVTAGLLLAAAGALVDSYASEGSPAVKIKGAVEEVSMDGNFIVVEGEKIMCSSEFLEESYLEVGDNIEITAGRKNGNLEALDFDYVYDDMDFGMLYEDDVDFSGMDKEPMEEGMEKENY